MAAMVGQVALLVWAYMTAWFVVALALRRNDVADIGWGPGFIVIAWWLLLRSDPQPPRLWIAALLVTRCGGFAWRGISRPAIEGSPKTTVTPNGARSGADGSSPAPT